MIVTLEKIHDAIDEIQARADEGDFESAHCCEDVLLQNVLEHIARTSSDQSARTLAIAALDARKIKFERVCA